MGLGEPKSSNCLQNRNQGKLKLLCSFKVGLNQCGKL